MVNEGFSLGRALGGHAYAGILCIKNIFSGRCFLSLSRDLGKDITSSRFDLDLGTHRCASLQADYDETGLEAFVIEPAAVVENTPGEAEAHETPGNALEILYQDTRRRLSAEGTTFYSPS